MALIWITFETNETGATRLSKATSFLGQVLA